MKKLSILFLLLVLCVATLFAQAPEKLSYQAVVRNASNQLISNAPVGVRVSILQGGVNGMMVYMETHTAVTNANGLVTLQIGGGTVQQGVFADIDWTNGPFFLKTETDHAGGSNYTVTSTQQLLSVPYALYAKEAGNVPQNVGELTNDVNYITISDIPEIPTVPTNVSAFVNDAGYITMDSVPTNVTAFTNDAGYLTSFMETDPEFNAWDKDYNDLINKPTIPTVPTEISAFANDAGYLTSFTEQQVLNISNDTIFLTGGSFVKLPEGFDGDYNSLTNKPTIPTTVGELTNDANYITLEQVPAQVNADWNATTGAAQILNKPELFSGDYNDLTNTPTIPTVPANVSEFNNDAEYVTTNQLNAANYITAADVPAQVNADWNATEGAAQILNKPELFSGDYNDLTNKPTIPTVPTNVGAFTNDAGYITAEEVPAVSVPTNVSAFNNDAEYVTTNQLNAANYITAADVPAQVNADWNATTGAAQILNKPELFSGDYNDLTNKPTIPTVPTNVGAFTNDAGYITAEEVPAVSVPTNVSAFNNDAEYVTTNQLNAANYITAADVPAQVNADWDATTGAAQILNKPTDVSAFTNDAGYITGYTETQTLADVTAQGNSAGNRQLKNVSDPTDPQDAVTKTYLDQLVNNLTGLVQNLLQQVDSLQNVVDALTGGSTTVTQPTVTTSAATNITSTSATLNGSISNPDNVAITAQGFEWKATAGGAYVAVNATGETMTYNLTGLTAGTSYTYRAFVTTAEGTSYGSEVDFTTTAGTIDPTTFTCGTSKMVDADGNEYETVLIGTQCWTKTNLRVAPAGATDGTSSGAYSYTVPYYYVKPGVDAATYGYYYNWEAAKLACPAGWHLPSDAEWNTLEATVSGSDWQESYATATGYRGSHAGKLAGDGWNSSTTAGAPGNVTDANHNASGFSAVPVGRWGGGFNGAGGSAYFWSSSESGAGTAWYRSLNYNYAGVSRYNTFRDYGFSVRCLRD